MTAGEGKGATVTAELTAVQLQHEFLHCRVRVFRTYYHLLTLIHASFHMHVAWVMAQANPRFFRFTL